MTALTARRRTGATLVELLVAMAIIAGLAALALMMMPSITNKDMTLKGTADVQGACKIAQGMAGSARLPRGVRFLIQPGTLLAYEMQYLEAPVVMVADPEVLVSKFGNDLGVNGPRVELRYELYDGKTASIDPLDRSKSPIPVPPAGTIMRRHCYVIGLNAFQQTQVADGAVLVMPVLNAWSRINGSPVAIPATSTEPAKLEVVLDVYPDASLGAGTAYHTYHFGIYGPPVPLLGEPTLPLPRNIAVDLEVSYPPARAGQPYYDVMFAPSGQTISTYSTATATGVTANTALYLWVRDTTEVDSMTPLSRAPWSFDPNLNQFTKGGEQQIVGIRNGFVGTAPVLWPNPDGTYSNVNGVQQSPYTLAQNRLN